MILTNFINKFFFIIIFFILEIKVGLYNFLKLINSFNEVKFLSLISYYFRNGELQFKNNDINLFLKKNKNFYKNDLNKNKKKILIELLLSHHSEPMIFNCLLGKDFKKYFNSECTALINNYDFLTKEIAKSFNINNFEYLDKNNFFKKLFYFIKALNLIEYKLIDKKIYGFKYQDIEIGKAALENYLRFYNFDPENKNKFLLYLCLYKALTAFKDSKKIFKKKYDFFIIAETQFVPNKILFHQSLKFYTPVYTWSGTSIQGFIGRIIKYYRDRNSIKMQYSKKLTKLLFKIFKNKNTLKMIFQRQLVKNIGKETIWSSQVKKKEINFTNKFQFNQHFKFKNNKKTVLVLPHAMSDNIYNNRWNIFNTAYDMFKETLMEMRKNKKVNWIIKPHPYEYKFKGITARNIYEKLDINEKNIIFLKDDVHINRMYKFIDIVITGNGSAGFEYSTLGIPTITTSDSKYLNFNFTISPKNKYQYFKILSKIHKIRKLDKIKQKKAQIYWLANNNLIPNDHQFLPKIRQHGFFKKKLFFKLISKRKNIRFKKNSFTDDLIIQLKNNNRHSINSNFVKKYNLSKELTLSDI